MNEGEKLTSNAHGQNSKDVFFLNISYYDFFKR